MTNISPVTPPSDTWQRWRAPGRNATLVVLMAFTDTMSEDCTTILNLIGHLPGMAACLEIKKELGIPQSFVPFFVPAMPRRWQSDLKTGQKFGVTLTRTQEETWEIRWISREEP